MSIGYCKKSQYSGKVKQEYFPRYVLFSWDFRLAKHLSEG